MPDGHSNKCKIKAGKDVFVLVIVLLLSSLLPLLTPLELGYVRRCIEVFPGIFQQRHETTLGGAVDIVGLCGVLLMIYWCFYETTCCFLVDGMIGGEIGGIGCGELGGECLFVAEGVVVGFDELHL